MTCKLAYAVIAARADVHDPVSADDATAYGLKTLRDDAHISPDDDVARQVAMAFAHQMPLTLIIETFGKIDTKLVDRSLKAFLAAELRRHGKATGDPATEFCDVSERSLRDWLALESGR